MKASIRSHLLISMFNGLKVQNCLPEEINKLSLYKAYLTAFEITFKWLLHFRFEFEVEQFQINWTSFDELPKLNPPSTHYTQNHSAPWLMTSTIES